jgi:hypothetical protein
MCYFGRNMAEPQMNVTTAESVKIVKFRAFAVFKMFAVFMGQNPALSLAGHLS